MKRSWEALSMDWFSFRAAEPTDAAAIVLLTEKAVAARKGELIPLSSTLLPAVERNKDLLAKPSTWSRLVFDDIKLIGLAIGHPATNAATGEAIPNREHLSLLMIDPDYWGQGVGGNLLDWVEREMTSRGVECVDLWTEEANDRSRTLYERKGYEISGVEQDHPLYGDHQLQYIKNMVL